MTTYNIYRRESSDSNPPVAIATGLTSMAYSDDTAESGKQYLYSVGVVKSGIEYVSAEIIVSTIKSYRYLRIYITANNGSFYIAINEIEMFTADSYIDETNPTQALTAASASQFSTIDNSQAFKAFDNNFSLLSNWVVGTNYGSVIPVSYPAWITYDFGIEKYIERIKIYPQPRSDLVDRTPKDFIIQGSNDNLTWDDIKAFNNVTDWIAGTGKTFNLVTGDSYIAGEEWTPMSSSSTKMFLCAEDLDEGVIEQWVCRKTGVAFKKPTHGNIAPTKATAITVGGARYAQFKNRESLCVDNLELSVGGLFSNKSTGYIFVVLKKDYTDTTPSSRRIFGFSNGVSDSSARFFMYADDATANSANKINVGGRRLDADSYQKLSTQQQVDQNTHIICGEVDHSVAKFHLTVDGGVKESGGTGLGIGTTANTVSKEIGIAGGTAGFDGRIAAIVFGNTQLTQLERQKLEGWAAHKYGLTDNLPIDHPYKTLPPTV